MHRMLVEFVIPSETVATSAECRRSSGDADHPGRRGLLTRSRLMQVPRGPLLLERDIVHLVGERLGVHETVLDGDLRYLGRDVVEQIVNDAACPAVIVLDFRQGGPVGWLISSLFSRLGIDAKGEKPIESRMERRNVERGS